MERIIYKPAMKSGTGFQIYIPDDAIKALEIEDRDELKLTVEKTGRKIPKTTRFVKKGDVVETSEFKSGNGIEDDPDEAEKEFIEKYKETGDSILLHKAEVQFGKDRVTKLLHTIKK